MASNPIWAEARRRAFSETIELLRLNSFPRVLLTVGTPLMAFAATWGLTGQLAVAALAALVWMSFCGIVIFLFKLISGPVQIAAEDTTEQTVTVVMYQQLLDRDGKMIIPGGSLLADQQAGLEQFIKSVSDIKIFFQTYAYSGN